MDHLISFRLTVRTSLRAARRFLCNRLVLGLYYFQNRKFACPPVPSPGDKNGRKQIGGHQHIYW
jgi:hypothetical protein